MSKQRLFKSLFLFLMLSIVSIGCQQTEKPMDPAALKMEVKKQFEAKGIAVIDSMTAICDKRVADASN